MTPQDWKEVEKRLKSLFHSVKLKCDGFDITLRLSPISQFKNGIIVYVNGEMKIKWLFEECEERKRFMRPVTTYLHSQKLRVKLKKLPKRLRQEILLDPSAKATVYNYYWTSFSVLKRHLITNNKKIELIKEDSTNEERGI